MSAPSRRQRRPRGFTLIELLVVLLLIGIAYTVVGVRLDGTSGGVQVKGATRQLAAGLRKARSVAVSERKEAVLLVDVERHQFSVTGDAKTYALPDTLEITLFTATSEMLHEKTGAIRFFPDGSSTGGRITLDLAGHKESVDVDWLTGKVALLDT